VKFFAPVIIKLIDTKGEALMDPTASYACEVEIDDVDRCIESDECLEYQAWKDRVADGSFGQEVNNTLDRAKKSCPCRDCEHRLGLIPAVS